MPCPQCGGPSTTSGSGQVCLKRANGSIIQRDQLACYNLPQIIDANGQPLAFNSAGNQILPLTSTALQTVATSAPLTGTGVVGNPVKLVSGSSTGQVPTWNGTAWVLSVPSAVPAPVATASPLQGDGTVGTPVKFLDGSVSGQVPMWNGTGWAFTVVAPAAGTIALTEGTVAPSAGPVPGETLYLDRQDQRVYQVNAGRTGWNVLPFNGSSLQPTPTLLQANTATPSVADVSYVRTNSTAPLTITNFTGGLNGQFLVVVAADANTTIAHSGSAGGVDLAANANVALSLGDVIFLVYDSDRWRQLNLGPAAAGAGSGLMQAQLGQRLGNITVETVGASTPRWYNEMGTRWTISQLRFAFGTAPTGSSATVVIRKNGSTIHTQSVTSGTQTLRVASLSYAVEDGDYLEVYTTAIGSTIAGANLTVFGRGVLT